MHLCVCSYKILASPSFAYTQIKMTQIMMNLLKCMLLVSSHNSLVFIWWLIWALFIIQAQRLFFIAAGWISEFPQWINQFLICPLTQPALVELLQTVSTIVLYQSNLVCFLSQCLFVKRNQQQFSFCSSDTDVTQWWLQEKKSCLLQSSPEASGVVVLLLSDQTCTLWKKVWGESKREFLTAWHQTKDFRSFFHTKVLYYLLK